MLATTITTYAPSATTFTMLRLWDSQLHLARLELNSNNNKFNNNDNCRWMRQTKSPVSSLCRNGRRDNNFYASRVQVGQHCPWWTTATFGKQDGNDDDGDNNNNNNNNNNNDWEMETHPHSTTGENDDSCQSTGANSYTTTTTAAAAIASDATSADSKAAVMVLLTVPMAWGTFGPAVRLVYQYQPNIPPLLFSLAYYFVAATTLLLLSWIQQFNQQNPPSTTSSIQNNDRSV
jgi:hypothetical protein